MYTLNSWLVMGLQANPGPPLDGRETQLTNPQRPAPIPEINQAGGAALPTGMPVFCSAPSAKVVVGTGQDGCRTSLLDVAQGQASPRLVQGFHSRLDKDAGAGLGRRFRLCGH